MNEQDSIEQFEDLALQEQSQRLTWERETVTIPDEIEEFENTCQVCKSLYCAGWCTYFDSDRSILR